MCEQADVHGAGGDGDARDAPEVSRMGHWLAGLAWRWLIEREAGRKLLGKRVHWRSLGLVLISWRQGLPRGKRESHLEIVKACGMGFGRRKILIFCNKRN